MYDEPKQTQKSYCASKSCACSGWYEQTSVQESKEEVPLPLVINTVSLYLFIIFCMLFLAGSIV